DPKHGGVASGREELPDEVALGQYADRQRSLAHHDTADGALRHDGDGLEEGKVAVDARDLRGHHGAHGLHPNLNIGSSAMSREERGDNAYYRGASDRRPGRSL